MSTNDSEIAASAERPERSFWKPSTWGRSSKSSKTDASASETSRKTGKHSRSRDTSRSGDTSLTSDRRSSRRTSGKSHSRKKPSKYHTDPSTASDRSGPSRRPRRRSSRSSQPPESAWTDESESNTSQSMSRDDPKSRTRTSRTTNDTRPDVAKGSESEKPLLPLSKLPLPPQSSFRSNLRKPAARFSDVNSGSSRSEQTGPTDSHVTDDSVRPPARRSSTFPSSQLQSTKLSITGDAVTSDPASGRSYASDSVYDTDSQRSTDRKSYSQPVTGTQTETTTPDWIGRKPSPLQFTSGPSQTDAQTDALTGTGATTPYTYDEVNRIHRFDLETPPDGKVKDYTLLDKNGDRIFTLLVSCYDRPDGSRVKEIEYNTHGFSTDQSRRSQNSRPTFRTDSQVTGPSSNPASTAPETTANTPTPIHKKKGARFDSTATEINTDGSKLPTSLGPAGNYVETDPRRIRAQADLSKSPSAWLKSGMCETLDERDKKLHDYTVTMTDAPRYKFRKSNTDYDYDAESCMARYVTDRLRKPDSTYLSTNRTAAATATAELDSIASEFAKSRRLSLDIQESVDPFSKETVGLITSGNSRLPARTDASGRTTCTLAEGLAGKTDTEVDRIISKSSARLIDFRDMTQGDPLPLDTVSEMCARYASGVPDEEITAWFKSDVARRGKEHARRLKEDHHASMLDRQRPGNGTTTGQSSGGGSMPHWRRPNRTVQSTA